jgi:hypothetical protein
MSIGRKEIVFLFAAIGTLATSVEPACQSMDASWDPDRGPLITQVYSRLSGV